MQSRKSHKLAANTLLCALLAGAGLMASMQPAHAQVTIGGKDVLVENGKIKIPLGGPTIVWPGLNNGGVLNAGGGITTTTLGTTGDVNVGGNGTVAGTLGVTGATTTNGITNTGLLTNNGNAQIVGDLDVTGTVDATTGNITNDLTVGHNAIVKNNLIVENDAEVKRHLSVGQDINVGRNAVIEKNLIVKNDAEVERHLSVGQDVNVGRNAIVNNDLIVKGNSDLQGHLNVGQDVNVGRNLSVGGMTNTNGINNNGQRIQNVGAAVAGTDAVNLNQLNERFGEAQKYTDNGVAAALAIPSMPTLAPGKGWAGMAVGNYGSATAVGLAVGYQVNERWNLGLGVSQATRSGGKTAVKAQAGFSW